MFNPGIAATPSSSKQRDAVRAAIHEAIANGTFTYTELLASQEPFRTFGLEVLDGVTVTGSKPTYGGEGLQDWGGQPFRLCHVEENGVIRLPVMKAVRVPGSFAIKNEKHWESAGNIADVYDHPHNRQARYLLQTKGWPVRQTVSSGNAIGSIVEWEWLVQEAARGEQARPGCIELHDRIAKRIEAWEAARAAAAAQPKKPIQNKGPEQRV